MTQKLNERKIGHGARSWKDKSVKGAAPITPYARVLDPTCNNNRKVN